MKKILAIKFLFLFCFTVISALVSAQKIYFNKNLQVNTTRLIISNSIKQDTLLPLSGLFKANNKYKLKISKQIPLYSKDSVHLDKFRGVYFENMPNSQKVDLTIDFYSDSIISAQIVRKSMDRRFNADYQIKLPIKNFKLTLSDSIHSSEKFTYGNFKASLPIEFGWFSNDTIINIDFRSKLFTSQVSSKKQEIPLKNRLSIDSLLVNDSLLTKEYSILYIDSLKNKCVMEIGSCDGLSGELISIFFYKKPFMVSKIKFNSYSDISENEHFEFSRYNIQLNCNPFETKKEQYIIGNATIATDQLPQKYGDKIVKNITFFCRDIIYKDLKEF
jgi:hypothetical protein